MTIPDIHFGNCLRLALVERGMSQSDLAEAAEFPAAHINHFLAGRREPSLKNIIRLCNGLKMTPDELFRIKPVRLQKIEAYIEKPQFWRGGHSSQ